MDTAALKIAIGLVQLPSSVKVVRSAPLPDGIPLLLRISAGDETVEAKAAEELGRPREVVRKAAGFFIEQILLDPDADSYRILGAGPKASASELRRNMALILRWLHPDINSRGDCSIFAGRVTLAWEDLKTPERRASYDLAKREHKKLSRRRRHRRARKAASIGAPSMKYKNILPNAGVSRQKRAVGRLRNERSGLLHRVLLKLLGLTNY